jgi:HEAT repeat protein
MGLLDYFTRAGRTNMAVARHVKRALDKNAFAPERLASLEKLHVLGTDEALDALVRRFGVVVEQSIEDEREKHFVYEALVGMGPAAIAPICRYIFAEDAGTLSYPLRVLEKVAAHERLFEIVDQLLSKKGPEYTRDPSQKIQLLSWLGEWTQGGAGETSRRVVPFLEDFDESVRFTAVDTLAAQRDDASARLPLLAALVRPAEESRRIKVAIAEMLVVSAWPVTEAKDALVKVLVEELPEFRIQEERLVRSR